MNTPPELVPILVNPRHLVLGQKLFFYGMVLMMIGVLVAGLLGWLKPAEKPHCYHMGIGSGDAARPVSRFPVLTGRKLVTRPGRAVLNPLRRSDA